MRTLTTAALFGVAVVLLSAAGLARAGNYESAVLADAPVGYWRFEEATGPTAADSSGNSRDGTLNGGVTLGSGGALPGGGWSATFDGSSGYVQLPGTWGGTAAVTVEAWVNTNDPITGNFQAVASATGSGFAHFQLHSAGSTGVYTNTGAKWVTPLPAPPTGTWRHVVLVAESGNTRVYENGVQVGASNTSAFATIDPHGDVHIGNGYAGGRWFRGEIDEVAIYDKPLSTAQVQSHYQASLPAYVQEVMADSPTTYYRFDETSGTTAHDAATGIPARAGTYGGSVNMAATSPFGGTLGAAKGFDGSSAYVDVPNLGGGDNSQFSIEMWLKPTYASGLHALYAADGWSSGKVHMNLTGSNVEMAVAGSSTPWPTQTLGSLAPAGTWNHLVVTRDVPADECKFYINGVLASTQGTNSTIGALFGPATIAAWNQPALTRYFGGDIDEFAIYQGTILSAARVAAHYDAALDPGDLALVETCGPLSAGNLAAASAGATAFVMDNVGAASSVNDGTFGNASSWYGWTDQGFAGIDLGGTQTIDHLAFGRSNTQSHTDRCLGNYTLQYTTVASPDASTPDSAWVTLGTLKYDGTSPTDPWARHLYSFPAIDATGVRILTDRNEYLGPHLMAIDEIEAYHGHPLTLKETGGTFASDRWNLSRMHGATPFAKDSLQPGGQHDFPKLNDGIYGNTNSWIGVDPDDTFGGIDLSGMFQIDRVAFGRDNGGESTAYNDRVDGIYTLQYTQVANPDQTTPDGDWTTIGQLIYTDFYNKALRHLFEFDPVLATGFRLTLDAAVANRQIAIDEFEIYQVAPAIFNNANGNNQWNEDGNWDSGSVPNYQTAEVRNGLRAEINTAVPNVTRLWVGDEPVSNDGRVDIVGGGSLTVSAVGSTDAVIIGGFTGSTGTLNVSGNGSLTVDGRLNVGGCSNALGSRVGPVGNVSISDTAAVTVGSFAFGSGVGGTGNLNMAGGTLTASGRSYLGGTEDAGVSGHAVVDHSGGTIDVNDDLFFTWDTNDTCNYTMSGAGTVLEANRIYARFGTTAVTQTGGTIRTGRLRLGESGTAVYNLRGGEFRQINALSPDDNERVLIAHGDRGAHSTVNHSGGSFIAEGDMLLAWGPSDTAEYHLSGAASLLEANSIYARYGNALITQSGGTIRTTSFTLGQGSAGTTATYDLSGGQFVQHTGTDNRVFIGGPDGGGHGVVDHTGGSFTTAGNMFLAWATTDTGEYTIGGTGLLDVGGNMHLRFGNGTFVQNGGTVNIAGNLNIGEGGSASTSSSYTINDGTLDVGGGLFVGLWSGGEFADSFGELDLLGGHATLGDLTFGADLADVLNMSGDGLLWVLNDNYDVPEAWADIAAGKILSLDQGWFPYASQVSFQGVDYTQIDLVIPEPCTLVLLGVSLAALAARRRRR